MIIRNNIITINNLEGILKEKNKKKLKKIKIVANIKLFF